MNRIFFQKSGRVTFLILSICKCMPSFEKIVSVILSNFLSHPSRAICRFGFRAPLKWRIVPLSPRFSKTFTRLRPWSLIDLWCRRTELTSFTILKRYEKNFFFYKHKSTIFAQKWHVLGLFGRSKKAFDLRFFANGQNFFFHILAKFQPNRASHFWEKVKRPSFSALFHTLWMNQKRFRHAVFCKWSEMISFTFWPSFGQIVIAVFEKKVEKLPFWPHFRTLWMNRNFFQKSGRVTFLR